MLEPKEWAVATCWFSFGKSNAATLWQWLCWTATTPSTTLHGAAWPCAHWQSGPTASSGHYPVGPTPTKNYWALECFACLTRGPLFGRFRSRAHCSVHHPSTTTTTASAKPPLRGPHTCYVPRRRLSCSRSDFASAPAAVLAPTTNSKPTLPLTPWQNSPEIFKYSFKTGSV